MNLPAVSVVVITRNEEKNIGDCLDSLVSLDYPSYEIIVADSSIDRTPQIAGSYRNVRVLEVKVPGFAHARNVGVTKSKNTVVAFTDADCIVPKDWLKRLVPHLGGRIVAVGGTAVPPKNSSYIGKCIACLGLPAGGLIGVEIMSDLSTCNAAIYRKTLDEIGGFDEKLVYGTEDSELSRRIKKAGYGIRLPPDSYVFHKTRTFSEFVGWCYRRGKAKVHMSKNPIILLYPLAVFIFPFTRKSRILIRKRKTIGISICSVLIVVPLLFLVKRLLNAAGWLNGIGESLKKEKECKEV